METVVCPHCLGQFEAREDSEDFILLTALLNWINEGEPKEEGS